MTRLVVLTDRSQVPAGRSLREVIAAAADGGLRTLLVREMDLPDDERAAIVDHARSVGLEVIAAHRAVPGSRGLHLPAGASVPAVQARWGRSCHSRADLVAAAADGAWWATLSPFAPTSSKPGHGPPIGHETFVRPPLPVYALGGITPHNAATARTAGAHGVAVMGGVMRAADPAAVVAALLAAVTTSGEERR